MHIHWIQHVDFEGLGNIQEWIDVNQHSLTCTRQYKNETLPSIDSFDMLIVMGGPMGVYDTDKYSWLKSELEFIQSAIQNNKVVLGICLGSQFIAAAMGAKVYPGPMKEIGWFPIQVIQNDILKLKDSSPIVFHWHGDTFDLPENAQRIASTPEVTNQAFSIGKKVIGLQFHLEQTEETILGMIENCGQELSEEGEKIQVVDQIIANKKHFEANKQAMHTTLNQLIKE